MKASQQMRKKLNQAKKLRSCLSKINNANQDAVVKQFVNLVKQESMQLEGVLSLTSNDFLLSNEQSEFGSNELKSLLEQQNPKVDQNRQVSYKDFCFLNAVSKVFQDSDDLNQQSLIKHHKLQQCFCDNPVDYSDKCCYRKRHSVTKNQTELDKILDQSIDRHTMTKMRRSNSEKLTGHESHVRMLVEQINQLKERLFKQRQENKSLLQINKSLQKHI